MEILISAVEDLIVTALCTSYPVDDLINTLRNEANFPAKFALRDWKENLNGLYTEQEHKLYGALKQVSRRNRCSWGGVETAEANSSATSLHPCPSRCGRVIRRPIFPKHPICHNDLPSHAFDKSTPSTSHEQMVLVATEDCLNKPISHTVLNRLDSTVRKIRVYLDLMSEVCSCDLLVNTVLERRLELHLLTAGRQARSVLNLPEDQLRPIWLRDLTIPYLYITTLRVSGHSLMKLIPISSAQIILELYSQAPDNVPWNADSPTDCRTLVGIVCRLDLAGAHILLFLAEVCDLLADFLLILPGPMFKPESQVCLYLLHMSFVLDCPRLFQIIVQLLPTQSIRKSPFDWTLAISEMSQCPALSRHMRIYLDGLRSIVPRPETKHRRKLPSSNNRQEKQLAVTRPRKAAARKKDNE